MERLKKLMKGRKKDAPVPVPVPLPAPTAEQIAQTKEEALERTFTEAERLFKMKDEEGGRRRNRKTRRAPKFRRGGSTAPMDAARMRELKVQYENDLKKTDVDMRPKIVALANEFKSRPGPYMAAWGQSLLTTLNMSEEEGGGLEMAKAMLTGFFSNVPEVQDTTRKSMGGRTRKYRQ